MRNKILLLFICLALSSNITNAQGAMPKNLVVGNPYTTTKIPMAQPKAQVKPKYTNFSECIKTYQMPTESLLYTCLSAINDNHYKIEEMQFKTGTILFSVNSKEFILITAKRDIKNSLVKILPADNNYKFPPSIINRIFSYIDLNAGGGVQNLI